MTEAELQAIEHDAKDRHHPRVTAETIQLLIAQIRSLRTQVRGFQVQLVSPSDELVETVRQGMEEWCDPAYGALSAIAKHLRLSGERLEEMER